MHYHGVTIWIESIDSTSSMAVISPRGTHEERQLVYIDGLDENKALVFESL
ncbi:small, acid-soluble spore protein, H family [Bacillus sp. ISL-55]|uniref:small, acid-soluble spore protein, H family n=1 Tax=Bacillus sp. ISL-55 TaxID=2819134 RepID=UPI001BE93FBC|nr:small, acid-soluble spore protein, H family [Bacillus sp. ISL-55]